MRLFTGRYQQHHPGQGVAVRTTVGLPRFKLGYPLEHSARLITPRRWMLGLDRAGFTAAYCDHLADAGVQAISAALTAIAAKSGEDRLVLLCFDDLTVSWCHRSIFAAWWTGQTGQEVIELAPAAREAASQHDQEQLF